MQLRFTLLLAPVLTAIVVLAAGQADAWFLTKSSNSAQSDAKKQLNQFKAINDVQDGLSKVHTGLYRTMAIVGSMDDNKIAGYRQELAGNVMALDKPLAQLSSGEWAKATVDAGSQGLMLYLKQADSAIDLASVDPNTGVAALQTADATFLKLNEQMALLGKAATVYFEQQSAVTLRNAQRLHLWLSVASLAMAVVAVGLSWRMIKRVGDDLAHATTVAQSVAAGNLLLPSDTLRRDEIGDLLRALGQMQRALRKVVGDIRHSSERIAVSGAEIAGSTQDLAGRTDEAASSLAQTTASMEELTTTVQQSADAALQASALAGTAAEVATRGGAVVTQVVETMEDINQSSHRIADIIGVIDGIAFQTNILALNAAVEAARAGEQGRGFAVVAGEVRSLAQRSAQAAKEIKDLITASLEKVEIGSKLVTNAGDTMADIVKSVHQVTHVIGEITAASTAQSMGIAHVNTAVGQLDKMTHQNSALVEQNSAAASSLRDQAQRLTQVVRVFQTGPQATSAAPVAAPVAKAA